MRKRPEAEPAAWFCPKCGAAQKGSICQDCGESRPEVYEPYYFPGNPDFPIQVNTRLGLHLLNGVVWAVLLWALVSWILYKFFR